MFRKGDRRRCGGVTVIAAAGEPGATHIGVVVGRKVGNAVTRNRAKRRIRAAAARLDLPAGVDIVVLASETVNDAPFESLVGWLADGLEAAPDGTVGAPSGEGGR